MKHLRFPYAPKSVAQKFHFAILRIEVTRASRGLSAIAESYLLNSRCIYPLSGVTRSCCLLRPQRRLDIASVSTSAASFTSRSPTTVPTTTWNCATVRTDFPRCSDASADAVIREPCSRPDERCGSSSSPTTRSNTPDFVPPFISFKVIE